MKCSKCKKEFEEHELDLSHDIPKYIGGTDKNGRHYLCKKCHKKYEQEVLNIILMAFIKDLPTHMKERYKRYAKNIKDAWFNGGMKKND